MTTTAAPALTTADVEAYRTRLAGEFTPCEGAGVFARECLPAIVTMSRTLQELDGRLTSANPRTKASVNTALADLRYWVDSCVTTTPGSAERRACIPKRPIPGTVEEFIFSWYQENPK